MNLKNWRVIGMVMALCVAALAAQAEHYECAMVKWDGPDKLQFLYPDRAEVIRVFRLVKPPQDINEEEFCLTWGVNRLSKEGWEPVNMDSRRVLLRRAPKS